MIRDLNVLDLCSSKNPHDTVVSEFLLEFAARSKGVMQRYADAGLCKFLNSIPATANLKGWGRGRDGFKRGREGIFRERMSELEQYPTVRVSANPDRTVTIRVKDAGISVVEMNKHMEPVRRTTKSILKLTQDAPVAEALCRMADVCNVGTELTFTSWHNTGLAAKPIWDVLNECQKVAYIERWGKGHARTFSSSAKVHIHNKMRKLAEHSSILVHTDPETYVRVTECPVKDDIALRWDSGKTTFVVEYCNRTGEKAVNKPAKPATPYVIPPSMGRKRGNVYALVNESMPGLFKVGRTISPPEKRARELSGGTNMPTPFEVFAYVTCDDYVDAERHAHNLLTESRVGGKEFFRTDCTTVLNTLAVLGGNVVIERDPTSFHITEPKLEVPAKPKVTKEMVIGAYVSWLKDTYDMTSKDIVLSPKDSCARVCIGTYGAETEWVTVPFGSLNTMKASTKIYKVARQKVMDQYGNLK